MPNRLPLPPELQQLIEKREVADRRSAKSDVRADSDKSDGEALAHDPPPPVERRKRTRRKSDRKK